MLILLYIILGLVASTLSGLLGIGGGLIVVPSLCWIWQYYHVITPDHLMPTVVATSMATSMITLTQTVWNHIRYGHIRWPICRQLAPSLIIGALIIGPILVHLLPVEFLQGLFALFSWFTSFKLLSKKSNQKKEKTLPAGWLMTTIGFLTGTLCSMLGIAGSSFIAPVFALYQMPIRSIIATSAFLGLLITTSSSVGFALLLPLVQSQMSLHQPQLIHWLAVLWICLPSLIGARFGTYLSQRLPIQLLKQLFAGLLFLIGCDMLYQVL